MAAEPREFDELENVDIAHTREEFRCWLENNHGSERECWLKLKRGRPQRMPSPIWMLWKRLSASDG